jgi:polysaccharide deacetylase family protein (PEP-CTERM system associated)
MSVDVEARPGGADIGALDAEPHAGGPFVLTFDFEDWHQLVHRRIGLTDWRRGSPAFGAHVATLLALLDDLGVRATFFVAGVTADRHPGPLADVVAAGHDVACHGYEHRRVFRQTPDEFRADVARCMEAVAHVCGVPPVGYRAPWFSITRRSAWAHEILLELGFRYDSSLYDSPRVPSRIRPIPTRPFRIGGAGGALWEFPIAVWRLGRAVLPLGGGAYWRALPGVALRHGLEHVARSSTLPVLYFHPYEFATEPLHVELPPGAPARDRLRETSRRLSKNARRHLIATRLRETATRFPLVSFREVLDPDRDDLDATLLRSARTLV